MKKDCSECQHYARTQEGPNAWIHDCRLRQWGFPHAWDCAFFQPPNGPEWPVRGMAYIWDAEYEGTP